MCDLSFCAIPEPTNFDWKPFAEAPKDGTLILLQVDWRCDGYLSETRCIRVLWDVKLGHWVQPVPPGQEDNSARVCVNPLGIFDVPTQFSLRTE